MTWPIAAVILGILLVGTWVYTLPRLPKKVDGQISDMKLDQLKALFEQQTKAFDDRFKKIESDISILNLRYGFKTAAEKK